MHAHIGDWLRGDDWRSEPVMQPGSREGFLSHLALGQTNASSAYLADHLPQLDPDPGLLSPGSGNTAARLRAAPTALCERWNC
jgi:hypothetical protein